MYVFFFGKGRGEVRWNRIEMEREFVCYVMLSVKDGEITDFCLLVCK